MRSDAGYMPGTAIALVDRERNERKRGLGLGPSTFRKIKFKGEKSMQNAMMIWLMGVGITANAQCFDFGGRFALMKGENGNGHPVAIEMKQTGCERVEVKFEYVDGSVVEVATSEGEVSLDEVDGVLSKSSGHFTDRMIRFIHSTTRGDQLYSFLVRDIQFHITGAIEYTIRNPLEKGSAEKVLYKKI